MVGTLRFAHLRSRHARPNSQQADAWKFVESDYDHLRIHELHENTKDVRPSPGYSQGQSGNTNLFHTKSQSNELTSR
jgi:hypothetical protein